MRLPIYFKHFALSVLASGLWFSSIAQVSFTETYKKAWGGIANDYVHDIIPVKNGYMFAGSTCSADGDVKTDVAHSNNSTDCWIISVDTSLNILWQKKLGGKSGDEARSIFPTGDGNYIIAGSVSSSDGDITMLHSPGEYDFWVAKISGTDGSIIWQKSLGGKGYDFISKMRKTVEGNYIIAGTTSSTDGDVSINHGGKDFWAISINPSGGILWEKTYGGSADEELYDVLQTKDGGFVFAGCAQSKIGGEISTLKYKDYYIVKTSATGAVTWEKRYGGTSEDIAKSILETDKGYIIAGYTGSSDGDVTGNHMNNSWDAWLVNIDGTGKLLWQKCYGGTGAEMFNHIIKHDNNYFAVGIASSIDGDVANKKSSTTFSGWITKLDLDGKLLTNTALGGKVGDGDESYFIAPVEGDKYLVAGSTRCSDVPNFHPSLWNQDATIIKLQMDKPTTINHLANEDIKVYPTLTQGQINIELPTGISKAVAQLISLTGSNIIKQDINSQLHTMIIDNVPAGIYMLKIACGSHLYNYKINYQP